MFDMKFKLGEPEHGWLPVELTTEVFNIQFEISDVPVNPIDQLIIGLSCVLGGTPSETWFHLEPASYYLLFTPTDGRNYEFHLEYSETHIQERNLRKPVFEAVGSKQEIILPFWRGVKEFMSHSFSEPAWPKCDELELIKLEGFL